MAEQDVDFLLSVSSGKYHVDHFDDPETRLSIKTHMQQFGARSILHIPLRMKGEPIGVVELWESRRRREFRSDEVALCSAIAQQAAIALEHARLYAAEHQQRQVAETLLQATSAIVSSLDLGQVLMALADQLLHIGGFHLCTISELERETGTVLRLAEHTRAVWPAGGGEAYRVDDYPATRQVLMTGEPRVVPGGMDDPELTWMEEVGLAAVLMLPLRAGEEIVGLAEVGSSDSGHAFTLAHTACCQRVLHEAAAWLKTPLQANAETALLDLAGRLANAGGCTWCVLSAWDRDEGEVRTEVEYAETTWLLGHGAAYNVADYPGTARALREGAAVVLRRSEESSERVGRWGLAEWGSRTLVLLPFSFKGEPVGLVELYDVRQERIVSEADLRLWQALADQAAVAIFNARLHAETERRLRRQTALQEAGMAISSTLEPLQVLARIAEQLGKAVNATSAYIATYDPGTSSATDLAEYYSPAACESERVSTLGQSSPLDDDGLLENMRAGRHDLSQVDEPGLPEVERALMQSFGVKTILCIPLHLKGEMVGIAELWESRRRREFTPEEIGLCQDLARQAAIALGNAELYNQAQQEILERKRAEAELRTSLTEKEVLLKEIHHRVKNNLQIISSVLNLQAGQGVDGQAAVMLRESQARVRSMALIHEKLYQSGNLSQIDFGGYLNSLAHDLLRSYAGGAVDLRLQIDAHDLRFGLDTAIPCGLIVNELISNALKHAFPADQGGTITVGLGWGGGQTKLTIADDGVGLPADLDTGSSRTLGLQLVHSLVAQLGGSLAVRRGKWTAFELTFTDPSGGAAW